MRRPIDIWLKRIGVAAAAILALPLAYLVAALVGGLVPANAGWTEADEGIRIFVRTNGVHTWLMVPKQAAGVDWRPLAPPEHLRDPRYGRGDYLAIGYGNRDFYLNTPTWADLSLPTAFAALFGRGPGLVHVEHEWRPQPAEDQKPILLSPDQYRRLAAHIHQSFDLGTGGSRPLIGRGYGPADIFYEARGRYDGYRTCNEWTGEALREAGVRMGVWTPLSVSVMARF